MNPNTLAEKGKKSKTEADEGILMYYSHLSSWFQVYSDVTFSTLSLGFCQLAR